MFIRFLYAFAIAAALSMAALAQDLPKNNRGYKVYQAQIVVQSNGETKSERSDAILTLGSPKLFDIGLSGVSFDVTAELAATDHSGRVDFLTFRDLRVNGIAVEVEEYDHPFDFKANERITLPKPIRIFVRADSIAVAAYKELVDSKEKWSITGRVFVFGKFKKFGFGFKRVVPVPVELKIDNPVKALAKSLD